MSRKEFYFTAFGEPAPQGSKNVYNGRLVEASKKVKPWRAAVKEAVDRAVEATGDESTFTDPVVIRAVFFMPKPSSVRRLLPTVAPDLDKLCRALGDALSVDTKILADDSLIVSWHATKVYAASREDAGVRVAIRSVAAVDIDNPFDSVQEVSEKLVEIRNWQK